jgi:hypothetical protein
MPDDKAAADKKAADDKAASDKKTADDRTTQAQRTAANAPAGRASQEADDGPSHGATPPVDAPNPPRPPPFVSGAQVILTGEAKAAARGDMHGTIENNAAARDAAIASGHVDPDTSPEAVADTLAASVGSTPSGLDPKAEADRRAAQQKEIADRARAAGDALRK